MGCGESTVSGEWAVLGRPFVSWAGVGARAGGGGAGGMQLMSSAGTGRRTPRFSRPRCPPLPSRGSRLLCWAKAEILLGRGGRRACSGPRGTFDEWATVGRSAGYSSYGPHMYMLHARSNGRSEKEACAGEIGVCGFHSLGIEDGAAHVISTQAGIVQGRSHPATRTCRGREDVRALVVICRT